MSKLLVVDTCTLSCTNGASATINPLLSEFVDEVRCEGKNVYSKIVALVSLAGYVSLPVTFSGTTTTVNGKAKALVLEDQTEDVTLTQSASPFSTISITVSILSTGQSKVKAV